jgi:hypothetical protein
MTVAAETRAAVREHPFLQTALRAGIVNYTAAARFLDVGDPDAVAAALRRYETELGAYAPIERRVSVSMRSGVGRTDPVDGALLRVGDETFAVDAGDLTAIVVTGDVDVAELESVLGRLRTAETDPVAAAAHDGTIVVVVDRRSAPDAVRAVEDALSA